MYHRSRTIFSYALPASSSVQQGVFELTECHVGNGSNLEMITLEALDSNNISFLNKKAWVERDAKMSWYHGLFGGQTSRCKVDSIHEMVPGPLPRMLRLFSVILLNPLILLRI